MHDMDGYATVGGRGRSNSRWAAKGQPWRRATRASLKLARHPAVVRLMREILIGSSGALARTRTPGRMTGKAKYCQEADPRKLEESPVTGRECSRRGGWTSIEASMTHSTCSITTSQFI
jgi:hypothetical protein